MNAGRAVDAESQASIGRCPARHSLPLESTPAMKSFGYVLLFIFLAIISWGIYGPLLQAGTVDMKSGGLPPFICVGIAYFIIAVIGPILLLKSIGERGHWTASGLIWSMIAGGSGAVGALGVILAMKNGGSPIYVMPLVFGGAPVVNSILTIALARSYKQVGPIFIAGLIIVMAGAVTVMVSAPQPQAKPLSTGELTVVLLFTAGLRRFASACTGQHCTKDNLRWGEAACVRSWAWAWLTS